MLALSCVPLCVLFSFFFFLLGLISVSRGSLGGWVWVVSKFCGLCVPQVSRFEIAAACCVRSGPTDRIKLLLKPTVPLVRQLCICLTHSGMRQTINVPHTVQNASMKIRLLRFFFGRTNQRSLPHNQLILAICAVERNLNYVRQTGCRCCGLIAKNNNNFANGRCRQS